MRSAGEIIMALVDSGLDDAQKALVLELAALATAANVDPAKAAKSARNARYYQSKKLNKATDKTPEARLNKAAECGLNATESALNQPQPRARVGDNPLRVIPLDAATAAVSSVTTWPSGSAADWAKALAEAAATSRLDPSREPGLTMTLGELVRWRDAGAHWEFDVLNVVVTLANKRQRDGPIRSWKFFTDAVVQSIADNRKALEIPEARQNERPNTPSAKRAAREDNLERGFRVGLAVAGS